jgi:hypothetical protein
MLKDNYAEYDRNKTRGIPRRGAALLQGLVYCGECGHKMVVQYKKLNRYICNSLRQQHGTPVCQFIPADPVDQQVTAAFFEALSPLELNAYDEALTAFQKTESRVDHALHQKLERLRYQAKLAERQFTRSDPDNRLVTAELERRWELALRDLKEAEAAEQRRTAVIAPPSVPRELKQAFSDLGKRLPEVWDQEILSREQQKAFLRCLIDKVVVHRAARDCLQLRIVWKGHATREFAIPIPVNSFAELSHADAMERAIIQMAGKEHRDEQIAHLLTERGYRSPLSPRVLPSTVQTIRLKHRILLKRQHSHPRVFSGFLTPPQLAKALGVTPYWIYDRINNGTITIAKDSQTRSYLFPDSKETIQRLVALKNGTTNSLPFSGGHQDA